MYQLIENPFLALVALHKISTASKLFQTKVNMENVNLEICRMRH